jgi:signal transduction histidine kinase
MKPTVIVAAVLLVLVPVLAALQYRWLGELSRAERREMQATLQEKAHSFGQACDRELARMYVSLQGGGIEDGPLDPKAKLKANYEAWLDSTPHAGLIQNLFFSQVEGNSVVLFEYDRATKTFAPRAWPPQLQTVLTSLTATGPSRGVGGDSSVGTFGTLVVPLPCLLLRTLPQPLPPACLPGGHWALATIDVQYLKEQFLPDLVGRSFVGSDGALSVYDIVVRDAAEPHHVLFESGAPGRSVSDNPPDATVEIFRLTPDALLNASGGTGIPMPNLGASKSLGVVRDSVIGSQQTMSVSKGALLLSLRRREGSVEAAVAGARNRNILLAFTMEAILAASIVLLLLSARGVHEAAKRQMAFVAGLSHDMRTPATVIQTLAQNQARGLLKEPQQVVRYGSAILGQTLRLIEYVERALRFAGLQSGRVIHHRIEFDAGELLKRAIELTRAAYPDSSHELRLLIDEGIPTLIGDPDGLCGAVQNLLANAIKYSGRETTVTLSARMLGKGTASAVGIAVEDQSWGIPPRDVSKIFKPFYRGRTAVTSAIPGTGLGLTLVKAVVEAHGGSIRCASTPGKGSKFTILLPNSFTHSENGAGT